MKNKIFEIGRSYEVIVDFSCGTNRFCSGEIVTFESEKYSPYDSSFAYQFCESDGLKKTWWVHEETAPEIWKQHFKPLLSAI